MAYTFLNKNNYFYSHLQAFNFIVCLSRLNLWRQISLASVNRIDLKFCTDMELVNVTQELAFKKKVNFLQKLIYACKD